MGSRFEEARVCLRRLLELEPENPAANQLILKAERAERLALATAKKASQRMLAACGMTTTIA